MIQPQCFLQGPAPPIDWSMLVLLSFPILDYISKYGMYYFGNIVTITLLYPDIGGSRIFVTFNIKCAFSFLSDVGAVKFTICTFSTPLTFYKFQVQDS